MKKLFISINGNSSVAYDCKVSEDYTTKIRYISLYEDGCLLFTVAQYKANKGDDILTNSNDNVLSISLAKLAIEISDKFDMYYNFISLQ